MTQVTTFGGYSLLELTMAMALGVLLTAAALAVTFGLARGPLRRFFLALLIIGFAAIYALWRGGEAYGRG